MTNNSDGYKYLSPDCNENPFLKKKIVMKSGIKLQKKMHKVQHFSDYKFSVFTSKKFPGIVNLYDQEIIFSFTAKTE